MALIYRPFFIVTFGSSYPWGGTAVADNFYGSRDWAERPMPASENRESPKHFLHLHPSGIHIGDLLERLLEKNAEHFANLTPKAVREQFYSGKTNGEIAKTLEMSLETVKGLRKTLGTQRRRGRLRKEGVVIA